ncbi:MAG: hypothetical protein LBF16_11855 [Pseudomonadales bacterium]|jgi:uncharacterized protein (TIGR00661 family)|nr:hypothetical protein [Pseudomonadales bacterium]
MRILYGVQGTGNGHISRALAMHAALQKFPGIDVTWLLSSRPCAQALGSSIACEWRKGLSFVARNGCIDLWQTLRQADLRQFWRDVNRFDFSGYDLVVSDYEPVIAHAARKRGIAVTGIGHQYAFLQQIPRRGDNLAVNALMKNYAPVTTPVGLHWHHFDQGILPPIVDVSQPADPAQVQPNKIIAYLPFENVAAICALLRGFDDYHFYIYHPELQDHDSGNLHLRAISRTGFKQDLFTCAGVITNAGFELISECLQWRKKIIAKPLHGQMEQLSNAAALEQLGYATVINTLAAAPIRRALEEATPRISVHYPDVAQALAQWIATGQHESIDVLAERLWQQSSLEFAGFTQSIAAA